MLLCLALDFSYNFESGPEFMIYLSHSRGRYQFVSFRRTTDQLDLIPRLNAVSNIRWRLFFCLKHNPRRSIMCSEHSSGGEIFWSVLSDLFFEDGCTCLCWADIDNGHDTRCFQGTSSRSSGCSKVFVHLQLSLPFPSCSDLMWEQDRNEMMHHQTNGICFPWTDSEPG
jgi:hypothetical protein